MRANHGDIMSKKNASIETVSAEQFKVLQEKYNALLNAQEAKASAPIIVIKNSKGTITIMSKAVKQWSAAKQKFYSPSFTMDKAVAEALFNADNAKFILDQVSLIK